jgi:hypothetical protein
MNNLLLSVHFKTNPQGELEGYSESASSRFTVIFGVPFQGTINLVHGGGNRLARGGIALKPEVG